MHIHYFQHVPFEGLGAIEPWLQQAGHTVSQTAFYQPHCLPTIEQIDGLIIMGGPMSVNDEAQYAWLKAEKTFIKQCIEAGKPVLGICLGAQLIASAAGAAIYANQEKEIGWFPIQSDNSNDVLPESITVFHWHGETFDLPKNAQRLASSSACKNQAFLLGDNIIGLQFHLETTQQSIEALLENCAADLVHGLYIQEAQTLRQLSAINQPANLQLLHKLLSLLF